MNSDFSRSAASSASLRSDSTRWMRAVSVTSTKVSIVMPSGSATLAIVDDAAVRPLHAAARLVGVLHVGDGGADRLPRRLVGVDALAVGDDLADMRLGAEPRRRQPPDIGEDRIEQAQPPIGAEHRDRLAQMVEGLALQLQRAPSAGSPARSAR